ncbi:ATP-binding protein [Lacipirellula sp.]|uniref:PAS domain-containing sensor histidine kinase n=1 Tax=Lacipirellula sp. TaxID=2691419 RepID=UPI003D0CB2D7
MRIVLAQIVGSAAPIVGELAIQTDPVPAEERIARLEAEVARLEAALHERATELDTLLNVIPVGIGVAFDPLCKRIRTNNTLANFLDLDAAENSSKTADAAERPTNFVCVGLDGRLIPDDQLPMQISARDGTEIRDLEFKIIHEDGRIMRMLGYSAPLNDSSGNPRGSVGAFIDITERRKAEENERQRLAEIAHANRLCTLGEMISGLAHELNQPLAAANNFARACQRWPLTSGQELPADVLSLLQNVSKQTERASEIVKRLTTFVKKNASLSAGVDVNELVASVITLTKSCFGPAMGRAEAIPIIAEFGPALPMIAADSIQIEQVLVNLIRNALESTVDSGATQPVIVRTSLQKECVRLDVIDYGAGIAANALSSLFQPFFTTKQEGLGLGLSISRSIIENHGGRLWAEINPERGATFSFELPIDSPPSAR